jgi:hypothetical protein
MKEAVEEIRTAVKEKMQFWHGINNRWIKAALILFFLALIGLKIFTTVLTFDWLSGLF